MIDSNFFFITTITRTWYNMHMTCYSRTCGNSICSTWYNTLCWCLCYRRTKNLRTTPLFAPITKCISTPSNFHIIVSLHLTTPLLIWFLYYLYFSFLYFDLVILLRFTFYLCFCVSFCNDDDEFGDHSSCFFNCLRKLGPPANII